MYTKYPRTYHLPWSEGVTDDDKVIRNLDSFLGRRVVVTEKMDGENTTMYSDHIHARSLDSRNHPSRNWVKRFWGGVKGNIPEGWRVCGENLYAKHSLYYTDLPTYFMGFSIWDDSNVCLSWEETKEWFNLLDVTPVPVIYYGVFDEALLRNLKLNWAQQEGYVVRLADRISYEDFSHKAAKFVRKNHVQTDKHWMHDSEVKANLLSQ